MKYFEDAFKFVTKNYLIVIPVFIATLVPALLVMGSTPTTADLQAILRDFQQYPDYFLNNPDALFEALRTAGIGNTASSGAISTILSFMAIPMTAGLVKLGLNKGSVSINDFALALGSNIGKYLRYFLATILFGLLFVVALVIYVIVMISILAAMGESGIFVFILGLVLLFIVSIAVAFFVSFWFGGMVLDDLGVWAALKKSFSIAKRCFWTLLGIALLIAVAEGIIGGVVGFFTFIPLLPTVLNSAVTAVATVVHTTFLFMLYRSFQPSDKIEVDDVNVIY
ncbi:MAG: hypothetical protein CVU85_08480 [Firmicutes bacterium HGW-Firmicutes-10]|jgi:hypothetical protein|nr:MAG: hypothetical protein CVU85_08480 [Firmicutes bacterium HGW-Firmicutes-10]